MYWITDAAKGLISRILLNRNARILAERVPVIRNLRHGLHCTHPFDETYGVDTSGYFPAALIHGGSLRKEQIVSYIGSQPSVVRQALSWLPDVDDYTFVDIGCGKGRALIIASEFPFERIMGLELSPALAGIARSNAARIRERFPERAAIDIIEGNALDNIPNRGKIVFYNYHAFGADLASGLIRNIELALAGDLEHAFVIYCNPVCAQLWDRSPSLCRWNADMLPFQYGDIDHWEIGFETVVIWQSLRGMLSGSLPNARRAIKIVRPNTTALSNFVW